MLDFSQNTYIEKIIETNKFVELSSNCLHNIQNILSFSLIANENSSNFFSSKLFRISNDFGITFSEWQNLSSITSSVFSGKTFTVIQLKFEKTGSPVFVSLSLNVNYRLIDISIPSIEKTFLNFENEYSVVLNFAQKSLLMLHEQGVLPQFIDRETNKQDFIDFYYPIVFLNGCVKRFLIKISSFENYGDILNLYLTQFNLFLRNDEDLNSLSELKTNLVEQFRQRGTFIPFLTKEQYEESFSDVVLNDGEFLRRIVYEVCDEYLIDVALPHESGWNIGWSSPLFKGLSKHNKAKKQYEPQFSDFNDVSKYPVFGNVTLIDELGEGVLRISALGGIGAVDFNKSIVVDPNLDYEISFLIKAESNCSLDFEILSYDCDNNPIPLRSAMPNLTDDLTAVNVFFLNEQLPQQYRYYLIRGIIFSKWAKNQFLPKNVKLNLNKGQHLRFRDGVSKIIPKINVSSGTVVLKNLKIGILRTTYSNYFISANNWINLFFKDNNSYEQQSANLNNFPKLTSSFFQSNSTTEELIREKLINYDSNINANFLGDYPQVIYDEFVKEYSWRANQSTFKCFEDESIITAWRGTSFYCFQKDIDPTPFPTLPIITAWRGTFRFCIPIEPTPIPTPPPSVTPPSSSSYRWRGIISKCVDGSTPNPTFTLPPTPTPFPTAPPVDCYSQIDFWGESAVSSLNDYVFNPSIETIANFSFQEGSISFGGLFSSLNQFLNAFELNLNSNPALVLKYNVTRNLDFLTIRSKNPRAGDLFNISIINLQNLKYAITNCPSLPPPPTPTPTGVTPTPTIPNYCPPYGTPTGETFCFNNQVQIKYHNGFCGFYILNVGSGGSFCCDSVTPTRWRGMNSYCFQVTPTPTLCPPRGTVNRSWCQGDVFIIEFHDGSCGFYTQQMSDSGNVCCEPAGTPIPFPNCSPFMVINSTNETILFSFIDAIAHANVNEIVHLPILSNSSYSLTRNPDCQNTGVVTIEYPFNASLIPNKSTIRLSFTGFILTSVSSTIGSVVSQRQDGIDLYVENSLGTNQTITLVGACQCGQNIQFFDDVLIYAIRCKFLESERTSSVTEEFVVDYNPSSSTYLQQIWQDLGIDLINCPVVTCNVFVSTWRNVQLYNLNNSTATMIYNRINRYILGISIIGNDVYLGGWGETTPGFPSYLSKYNLTTGIETLINANIPEMNAGGGRLNGLVSTIDGRIFACGNFILIAELNANNGVASNVIPVPAGYTVPGDFTYIEETQKILISTSLSSDLTIPFTVRIVEYDILTNTYTTWIDLSTPAWYIGMFRHNGDKIVLVANDGTNISVDLNTRLIVGFNDFNLSSIITSGDSRISDTAQTSTCK